MASAQNTRERLLDAAEGLFFQEGIAVTAVDRVAEAAGVAIVTLYKHFGSKDNLLREVLARRLEEWTRHWDAALAAATTPDERLLAIFDAIESFRAAAGDTQWCCFLATASERPTPDGDADDPVFDLIRQDTGLVAGRLADLAREARYADPDDVAASILLLYNGVLGSLLRGEPAEPVPRARAVARAVIDASPGESASGA